MIAGCKITPKQFNKTFYIDSKSIIKDYSNPMNTFKLSWDGIAKVISVNGSAVHNYTTLKTIIESTDTAIYNQEAKDYLADTVAAATRGEEQPISARLDLMEGGRSLYDIVKISRDSMNNLVGDPMYTRTINENGVLKRDGATLKTEFLIGLSNLASMIRTDPNPAIKTFMKTVGLDEIGKSSPFNFLFHFNRAASLALMIGKDTNGNNVNYEGISPHKGAFLVSDTWRKIFGDMSDMPAYTTTIGTNIRKYFSKVFTTREQQEEISNELYQATSPDTYVDTELLNWANVASASRLAVFGMSALNVLGVIASTPANILNTLLNAVVGTGLYAVHGIPRLLGFKGSIQGTYKQYLTKKLINIDKAIKVGGQFAILGFLGFSPISSFAIIPLISNGFLGSLLRRGSARKVIGNIDEELVNKVIIDTVSTNLKTEVTAQLYDKFKDTGRISLYMKWATGQLTETEMEQVSKWKTLTTREDIVSSITSGPQNLFVDALNVHAYEKMAYAQTLIDLGIEDLQSWELFKNDPSKLTVFYGQYKARKEFFLMQDSEGSLVKGMYGVLYDAYNFFGHWGKSGIKQLFNITPLALMRRMAIGTQQGKTTREIVSESVNSFEMRMFASSVVYGLLMFSKLSRAFGDDDEDKWSKNPILGNIQQKIRFAYNNIAQLSSYMGAFMSNGLSRQFVTPLQHALALGWDATSATTITADMFRQMLAEINTSKPFLKFMDSMQARLERGSATSEDIYDIYNEGVQAWMDGYANIVAGVYKNGLNADAWIPQVLKTNADLSFIFGQPTNKIADENFIYTQINGIMKQLTGAIKYIGALASGDTEGKDYEKNKALAKDLMNRLPGSRTAQKIWDYGLTGLFEADDHKYLLNKDDVDSFTAYIAKYSEEGWGAAKVDWSSVSKESRDFLLETVMDGVFSVYPGGSVGTNITTEYLSANGDIIKGYIGKDGEVKDYDLYHQVFLDKLSKEDKSMYDTYYAAIRDAKSEDQKTKAIAQMLNGYQDVAPKVKLALAMRGYMDAEIEKVGGNKKWALSRDFGLPSATQEIIKANTLNTFQELIRDVDYINWTSAYKRENKGMIPNLTDQYGNFDSDKIGGSAVMAFQSRAMAKMLISAELARGNPDPDKINNYFNTALYQKTELYKYAGKDPDIAAVLAVKDYLQLLHEGSYNAADIASLTALAVNSTSSATKKLFTDEAFKEAIGKPLVNTIQDMIYSGYTNIKDYEDRQNELTDMKKIQSYSINSLGINGVSTASGGGSGMGYSDYYGKYPNQSYNSNSSSSFKTYMKDLLPFYFKESRENFALPNRNYYSNNGFNQFKSQQDYAKNTYIQGPRLNKAGGNVIGNIAGRGKGFAIKYVRTKSAKIPSVRTKTELAARTIKRSPSIQAANGASGGSAKTSKTTKTANTRGKKANT